MQTINTEVFNGLKGMMGDIIGELVVIFIEDSYKLLDEIKHGIDNNNSGQIGKATHTLKSSAKNIGADKLANLCLEIEENLDSDLLQIYQVAYLEMNEVKQVLNELSGKCDV